MADQVNLPGGLTPGTVQTFQIATTSPQPKAAPPRPLETKPKASEGERSVRDAGEPAESLEEAKKTVEAFLKRSPSELKFVVDQDTGLSYFKIVDPVTRETILQVPAEEVLQMSRRLRALTAPDDAPGLLMDAQG